AITALLFTMLIPGKICKAQKDTEYKILAIHSFSQGYKWTDGILNSFSKEINSNLKSYQIYNEYLDAWHFNYNDIKKSVKDVLKVKYNHLKPDIIFSTDDYAFDFIVENYRELFEDIPVIFCGVNHLEPETLKALAPFKNNFTGIIEQAAYGKTIELVTQIHPDIPNILILADNTICGQKHKKSLNSQINSLYDNLNIDILDGKRLTTAQMHERIKKTDDTAIIASVWTRGKENTFVNPVKTIEQIIANSKLPVYTIDSALLGYGVIGGNVNSELITGRKAGKIAAEIILGKNTSDFLITTNGTTRTVLDLDEILKYNISISSIPVGSDIVESGGRIFTDVSLVDDQLTPWEIQWLNKNPIATVAVANRPPLIEISDSIEGFAVDYIKLIAKETRLKLDFKYKYQSTAKLYQDLNSDDSADIIIAASETPDRLESLNFTEPWLRMQYALFVSSREDLLFYNGLKSLTGKIIAIEEGSKLYHTLKREYNDLIIFPVKCASSGIKAVQEGKAFGWLGDHTVGLYLIRKFDFKNVKVGTSVYELGKHNLSLAVKKDKAILFEILKKSMDRVSTSQVNALRQKYSS
ncbi:MAG: transporter substrate-binding domain-containing protein, partial [Bacteroidales bacterium]|nr:transporter substrate-binding domain-containing protein [Bacteroidales bacterium]